MGKLAEAEKTIAQVRADGVKKDQEIAALRKETSSLKEQLAQAQKESGDYQRQMATLQQKLTEANTQISQMKADNAKSLAERNRLQEENQILRGVVLRQQKEEARRAQTKKLVSRRTRQARRQVQGVDGSDRVPLRSRGETDREGAQAFQETGTPDQRHARFRCPRRGPTMRRPRTGSDARCRCGRTPHRAGRA